jgi:hypothetical protein
MDGEELGSDRGNTAVCFSVQNVSQVRGLLRGGQPVLGLPSDSRATHISYSLKFRATRMAAFCSLKEDLEISEYRVVTKVSEPRSEE